MDRFKDTFQIYTTVIMEAVLALFVLDLHTMAIIFEYLFWQLKSKKRIVKFLYMKTEVPPINDKDKK